MYGVLIHTSDPRLATQAGVRPLFAHFFSAEGNDWRAHDRSRRICSTVVADYALQAYAGKVDEPTGKGLASLFDSTAAKPFQEGVVELPECALSPL